MACSLKPWRFKVVSATSLPPKEREVPACCPSGATEAKGLWAGRRIYLGWRTWERRVPHSSLLNKVWMVLRGALWRSVWGWISPLHHRVMQLHFLLLFFPSRPPHLSLLFMIKAPFFKDMPVPCNSAQKIPYGEQFWLDIEEFFNSLQTPYY